jgi:hypothetical protein
MAVLVFIPVAVQLVLFGLVRYILLLASLGPVLFEIRDPFLDPSR